MRVLSSQRTLKHNPVQVPVKDFALGTFAGLVVSTSGNNIEEKRQAQQLVENGGGRYSAEFTRQCTHLVLKGCRTRASEKEKCATAYCKDATTMHDLYTRCGGSRKAAEAMHVLKESCSCLANLALIWT